MFRDYMKIRKEEGYKTPKGPDTHPSTEVAEQRGHRAIDADTHPTDTPSDLTALSSAALAVLARDGAKTDHDDGTSSWHMRTQTPDGMPFDITLTAPDLPSAVADKMILPSDIPKNPHWRETYHLSVAPPNVALELTWGTDEPLRILNFSRGDWESQLLSMAP